MRAFGWEKRLLAVIGQCAHQPYALGVHDCFRLVCRVIEALTLVDRWPEFTGRYATKREALALIHQYGPTFDAAFSTFFGSQPVVASEAQIGDALKFVDDVGEAHLGVCLGEYVVVPGPEGLKAVPTYACVCCWRIG